jgi:hypothetical protein
MSWAMRHIATLKEGKPVTFKPRGNSMDPKIKNGQEVTVSPIEKPLEVGDVVLCRVQGVEFLHEIKAMQKIAEDKPGRFQIGNAKGRINGWTFRSKIYGILTHIEGKEVRKAKTEELPVASVNVA